MGKTNMLVIGGLGGVWLVRKYNAAFDPFLENLIEIKAIADVYDKGRVEDPDGLKELLEWIESNRLDKPINSKVKQRLMDDIRSRRIKYYQIDPDEEKLDGIIFNEVDSVDISSPNKFHYSHFQQAFNKNLDIICEKPSVASLIQTRTMDAWLDIKNGKGLKAMCCDHYRYYGCVNFVVDNFDWIINSLGLGKVNKIECKIFENDDFRHDRNQQIILLELSSGGIGLDTGIHPISFAHYINALLHYDECTVRRFKSDDPRIQDDKFGETAMEIEIKVGRGINDEYFSNTCYADIKVAKCVDKPEKYYKLFCENGEVVMDILNKKLLINGFGKELMSSSYPLDAFFGSLHEFCDSRKNGRNPRTSYRDSLKAVEANFLIYSRAGPIEPASNDRPEYNHFKE